jgi:hypothetical protein
MQVVSKIKESQVVRIILDDGRKDSITLQGRGKATLPAGATLDPNHEHALKVTVIGTPTASIGS